MSSKNYKLYRKHKVEIFDMIYDTYKMAKEIGFDIINMDLIAGLPDETPDDFMTSGVSD